MGRDEVFTAYSPPESGKDLEGLEKLHRETPNDPDILDWLAFSHYSAGSNERAMELYRRLVGLAPDTASYRYYLGNLHYRLGEVLEARVQWDACLEAPEAEGFEDRVRERLRLLDEAAKKTPESA